MRRSGIADSADNPHELRAWADAFGRAAFDLGLGPLVVIAAIEPLVLWPLAFGIVSGAALLFALPLAWARRRFGQRLGSPWLVAFAIALACLLAARPWWLRTGWPIALGCAALFATGPLWVRLLRSRRSVAIALWTCAALGAWGSARVFVGLYSTLHLAAVILALSIAALAAARALPAPSPRASWLATFGMAACLLLSLTPWGARPEARSAAVHRRSITPDLLRLGWSLLDLDGDGAASAWGGADCAPFDANRGPDVTDVPGDGIDQDCTGHDRQSLAAAVPAAAPAAALVRSVLIVTGDSLRYDALGAYGKQKLPVSVNIDAWARGAVRFQRAYSAAPETRSSLPTLLWGKTGQGARTPSLAERVRAQSKPAHAVLSVMARFAQPVRRAGFAVDEVNETDSLRLNAHVFDTLANVARDGGVLWVHYNDPHAPYVPVPGIDWGEGAYARYLGLVTRLDRAFGELLTRVPADMAVILASDHGEAFGEHGSYYHRTTLYDEQVHVPLLIAVPGIRPHVVPETVGVVDIYATTLELLGLAATPGVDSRSLVPALRGAVLPDAPYRATTWSVITDLDPARAWVGVFYGDFKLLRRTDWKLDEVYDLVHDPLELQPNAGRAADMRSRLLELL